MWINHKSLSDEDALQIDDLLDTSNISNLLWKIWDSISEVVLSKTQNMLPINEMLNDCELIDL